MYERGRERGGERESEREHDSHRESWDRTYQSSYHPLCSRLSTAICHSSVCSSSIGVYIHNIIHKTGVHE